jgi:hypothetical protein
MCENKWRRSGGNQWLSMNVDETKAAAWWEHSFRLVMM